MSFSKGDSVMLIWLSISRLFIKNIIIALKLKENRCVKDNSSLFLQNNKITRVFLSFIIYKRNISGINQLEKI